MADCSKTRIMAIALGVLCLTFAVVIAVFIYRELRHKEREINADNINSFFPAYFRSPDEQLLYERRYMSGFTTRTVVEPSISNLNVTCGFSCGRALAGKKRKKRQLAAVEHGCCKSNVAFIAPKKRINVNGRERTLLQFDTKGSTSPYTDALRCSSVKVANVRRRTVCISALL
ncbi:uncharacterized protein LOC128223389 [Mya arenaria]|uniref:uncharacterized protein LOC128223389 n=1 Tax=Mya arenaria TaxID=6604 RepID=UPI0022E3F592|nr:uncharacterized protein LOC128223389 [Mya arenaria]